jgi:D-3-phosphoglycerate dehydrogenase
MAINCAWGGLLDGTALHQTLGRGHVLAAALDTFEHEPPRCSPLLTRPDVVMTPHLAGATLEDFKVFFRRGLRNTLPSRSAASRRRTGH